MVYDHKNQFRAVIVRGKAQSDLDDLLPFYAETINELDGERIDLFREKFNQKLLTKLPSSTKIKTLDNHRTEIAGKLFGLFYESDEFIRISERGKKILETNDQPAFFKELCTKYQFPSGMNKIHTIKEMIEKKIKIKQFSFFLKFLLLLSEEKIIINKKQAGYYIFNSLDVLQNIANPLEVVEQVKNDLKDGISREVNTPGKASSYDMQHITEQLKLLELANVIYTNSRNELFLNFREREYILKVSENWSDPPVFDFSKYDFDSPEQIKKSQLDWDYYFSKRSQFNYSLFNTSRSSLQRDPDEDTKSFRQIIEGQELSKIELGNDGEEYVYEYEVKRLTKISSHYSELVENRSSIKKIGYDIKSIIGTGIEPEKDRYIEVKSTKRVTKVRETNFNDQINMTGYEWRAAKKYGSDFYIYRVYFTSEGPKLFVINDPYQKKKDQTLEAIALDYRVTFTDKAGAFF